MALIFIGLKASRDSEGKKRLSTITLTCCVEAEGAWERLVSKAFQTPAHLALQREVDPHAWK
jgi:hypothetical protein